MDIGKVMLEIRENAGISRATMAKHLNIRSQSVWKIEKGKSWPKPTTIAKFCQVVGIPLAYLYAKSMTIDDYIWPDVEKHGIPAEGQPQIINKV